MKQAMNMNQPSEAELISALVDGQLSGAALEQALLALRSSTEAQAQWHAYHLVGDVMRSGKSAPIGTFDEAFMTRLRGKLKAPASQQAVLTESPPVAALARQSANDALWRWKLVAGVSALGVALVLGWQLVGDRLGGEGAVQLAGQSSPLRQVQAQTEREPVMIRDPRLDQLLAAHQQFGGTSALQMPAGFLRNATFERPAP